MRVKYFFVFVITCCISEQIESSMMKAAACMRAGGKAMLNQKNSFRTFCKKNNTQLPTEHKNLEITADKNSKDTTLHSFDHVAQTQAKNESSTDTSFFEMWFFYKWFKWTDRQPEPWQKQFADRYPTDNTEKNKEIINNSNNNHLLNTDDCSESPDNDSSDHQESPDGNSDGGSFGGDSDGGGGDGDGD